MPLWNRTTDLRFTNQWKGIAQVIDDSGNPRPTRHDMGKVIRFSLFQFVSRSVSLSLHLTPI